MEAAFPETDFAARIVDAMSVVSWQAHCSVTRALVLMKSRAAGADLSLEQVALLVLDGEMRFDL